MSVQNVPFPFSVYPFHLITPLPDNKVYFNKPKNIDRFPRLSSLKKIKFVYKSLKAKWVWLKSSLLPFFFSFGEVLVTGCYWVNSAILFAYFSINPIPFGCVTVRPYFHHLFCEYPGAIHRTHVAFGSAGCAGLQPRLLLPVSLPYPVHSIK